jgi:hypothetical protein
MSIGLFQSHDPFTQKKTNTKEPVMELHKYLGTRYANSILVALQKKPTYAGTDLDEIRAGRRLTDSKLDRRRAAAKRARAARKAQR